MRADASDRKPDRFASDEARALGARGCHVKPIDFDRLRTDIDAYC